MSVAAGALGPAGTVPKLAVTGAMLSDVGRVRSHNEDSVGFILAADFTAPDATSLLLVADGMGGHAAGEVASRLAVEVIRQVFFSVDEAPPVALSTAFMAANRSILRHAGEHPECVGMGTTCTAIAVYEDRAWLAHVGDSRAYLWRDGRLTQLSDDQTLVARMIRDGMITPDEATCSEHSNVILQAVGTQDDLKPQIWSDGLPLLPGDVLALSSDGLHGLVSDDEIARVAGTCEPQEACQKLVSSALEAGGTDNISVGIFSLSQVTPPTPQPGRTTRRLYPPDEAEIAARMNSKVTRRIPDPRAES